MALEGTTTASRALHWRREKPRACPEDRRQGLKAVAVVVDRQVGEERRREAEIKHYAERRLEIRRRMKVRAGELVGQRGGSDLVLIARLQQGGRNVDPVVSGRLEIVRQMNPGAQGAAADIQHPVAGRQALLDQKVALKRADDVPHAADDAAMTFRGQPLPGDGFVHVAVGRLHVFSHLVGS